MRAAGGHSISLELQNAARANLATRRSLRTIQRHKNGHGVCPCCVLPPGVFFPGRGTWYPFSEKERRFRYKFLPLFQTQQKNVPTPKRTPYGRSREAAKRLQRLFESARRALSPGARSTRITDGRRCAHGRLPSHHQRGPWSMSHRSRHAGQVAVSPAPHVLTTRCEHDNQGPTRSSGLN